MTHKKCVVFYYEAIKITEMREKLLTRGGVYIFRNLGIIDPILTPNYFFSNLFLIVQSFDNFRKKKNTIFHSSMQGSERKMT